MSQRSHTKAAKLSYDTSEQTDTRAVWAVWTLYRWVVRPPELPLTPSQPEKCAGDTTKWRQAPHKQACMKHQGWVTDGRWVAQEDAIHE